MAKRQSKADKALQQERADIVAEMRRRYDQWTEAERHNVDAALLDLKLLVGEEHWDSDTEQERRTDGRPCLVVNQLPVFTRQVIGDQRQSRPSTQIIPSDKAASSEVAETIEGKLREIKYQSKADSAHDTAFGQAVRSSFGYWRITTEYENDQTFDQCVRIKAIPNQFGVRFDPLSTQWDKLDAEWLIVETVISEDTFNAEYPGHEANHDQISAIGPDWYSDEGVRIVEYFKKRPKPAKTIWAMQPLDTFEDAGHRDFTVVVDNADDKAALLEQGYEVVKERQIDQYEIVRYKLCGFDILDDEEIWPSKYWPVIEVLGETVNINGKSYKRSLIRDAHDSQRSYNYAISSEVETFSLAPKTPIVATPKQLQGHEGAWRQAHKRTYPFLYTNPDPAAPGWPQRVDAPQLSTAITSFRAETKQTLRDTIGIFNASIGESGPEVSGIAIERRQREADTGTFIWMDNLQYALELEDRTILDLLPKIYDTNRTIMTRSMDGSSKPVEINKPIVTPEGERSIENDLTAGTYDVVVTMGPSFSTQRQEARANMMDLIGKVPNVAPFILDKLIRSMDFHDASDIALRLLKGVVPREVLTEDEQQDLPETPQPQGPDPLTMAQLELAGTTSKLNLTKAEKTLAEVEKIKFEIGQAQEAMTLKVMQAIEQKLSGMFGGNQGQFQGSQAPQVERSPQGQGVGQGLDGQ
jgi:hypothetical protein